MLVNIRNTYERDMGEDPSPIRRNPQDRPRAGVA